MSPDILYKTVISCSGDMSPDISYYMVISYSGDMSPDILLYTSFSYSGDLSPEFLFKTAISYSGDSDILSPEFLFKTAISYSGDILSPEYPSPMKTSLFKYVQYNSLAVGYVYVCNSVCWLIYLSGWECAYI